MERVRWKQMICGGDPSKGATEEEDLKPNSGAFWKISDKIIVRKSYWSSSKCWVVACSNLLTVFSCWFVCLQFVFLSVYICASPSSTFYPHLPSPQVLQPHLRSTTGTRPLLLPLHLDSFHSDPAGVSRSLSWPFLSEIKIDRFLFIALASPGCFDRETRKPLRSEKALCVCRWLSFFLFPVVASAVGGHLSISVVG